MGAGKTIGSILGGALGTIIAPGVGTSVGASLGGAAGGAIEKKSSSSGSSETGAPTAGGGTLGDLTQADAAMAGIGATKTVAGMIKQKKADAMLPQLESPEERALSSYAGRRKRAFRTGTAMSAQTNALRQNLKSGISASFKVGGGAKGLNMMTRLFNQSQLGLAEKALLGESQFFTAETAGKTRLSQRKLELGLLKYNIEQARAAQLKKEGKATGNLALARTLGVGEVNPYGTGGQQNKATSTTGTSTGIGVEQPEGEFN